MRLLLFYSTSKATLIVNMEDGSGKRPATRSGKSKLPAKKRKLLINDIVAEDQQFSEEVLSVFWSGQHFKEYQVQCAFYDLLKSN